MKRPRPNPFQIIWLLLLLLTGCFYTRLNAQAVLRAPLVCASCKCYVYPEFTVIKDTDTWQTVIETYNVIGANVKPGVKMFDRSKFPFHADPGQPDMSDDYYKSGYAIGHESSAKNNASDQERLKHSMLWINTNLQEQSMNAGPWLGLENHERAEAIRLGTLHVKTGVYGSLGFTKAFDAKHAKVHRAVIPAFWWKALCYRDSTVVWVMPNVKMPQHTADYTKKQFRKSLKFLTDTAKVQFSALK